MTDGRLTGAFRASRHLRRSRTAPVVATAVAASLLLLVSACTPGSPADSGPGGGAGPSGAAAEVLPAAELQPLVDAQAEHATPAAAARLAEGLTPPTSSWFSALVFGDEPLAVFPQPLSFVLQGSGFALGVPEVQSTPDAVLAPAAPVVQVGLPGDQQLVSRYDDVSVTIEQRDGGEPVGATTIARGSPVVSYTAETAQDVTLQASFAEELADGLWSVTIAERIYALVAPDGTLTDDGLTLSLPAGATASWLAAPDGADASAMRELAGFAAEPVDRVATGWAEADGDPVTRLDYRTESGGPVLVGAMAHQRAGGAADAVQAGAGAGAGEGSDPGAAARCGLGTYSSAYGEIELCATSRLEWRSPSIEPTASLDVSALDDAEATEVREQLALDIEGATEFAADTYFGGKHLARLANLLQLARDLGDDELAATAQGRLAAELRRWAEPGACDDRGDRCFAYDPEQRGMVGFEASFGADEYNDHHFHYGYFLHAAGVAAADDAALRDDLAPVMTLLAADLASGETSELFPARRAFDPYSGHSWASGFAPFGDGNNQESSSEAVAAWNGLALWAAAAGDAPLEREARWMLAAEAASATSYWTDFDRDDPAYADYAHGVVGIVWDGKRDYATWFSGEPAAMLGIQLIPMTGVSDYLAVDPERIRANVAEVTDAGPPAQFGDLLLMYRSLAGPEDAAEALAEARELPDAAIDDGNSRAMLLAFIASHG